jgi:hypothetical protein
MALAGELGVELVDEDPETEEEPERKLEAGRVI